MDQEFLEIGQIANTFGVKGMIKIIPYTDDIKRFDELNTIYIENKKGKKEYQIEDVKYHKNMVLMKIKGINTIEEAEFLKESYVKIDRKKAIPLEKDTYFIVDLIGLEVYTDKNEFLGNIVDIYNTGSNDIYVVKNKEGKQLLLPAIEDVIKNIDIKNKKIVIHIIDGLI